MNNINIPWPTIHSAATGVAYGAQISETQANEKVFLGGRNYFIASIFYQHAGLNLVFNNATTLLSKALYGRSVFVQAPFFFSLNVLSYTTHALVLFSTIIENSTVSSGTSICDAPYHFLKKHLSSSKFNVLTKCTHHIMHNVGNVIQIGHIAYSAFRYYEGFKAEAIASLTVMGLGVLDRQGRLGQNAGKVFNKCLPALSAMGILLSASPLLLKVAAVSIIISEIAPGIIQSIKNSADTLMSKFYQQYGAYYPDLEGLETVIDPKQNDDLTANVEFKKIEVDFAHLAVTPQVMLNTKDVNFDTFNTVFESINWKSFDNFPALEKLIVKDFSTIEYLDNYFSLGGDPQKIKQNTPVLFKAEQPPRYEVNKKNPEAVKEWEDLLIGRAREKLSSFIQTLQGKKRLPGDLRGISQIKSRALQVAAFLKDCTDPKLQREILLELAINGDYTIHTMQLAISKCYGKVLNAQPDLKTRLLYHLQEARAHLVHEWYDVIQKNAPFSLSKALGFEVMQEKHIYNEFYRFIHSGFSLDKGNVGQDRTVSYASPLADFVRTLFPYFRHAFFSPRPYTEDKAQFSKKTLDVMKTSFASLKRTIYGTPEETSIERIITIAKGFFTIPRDLFNCANAAVFVYFEGITGSYRYDAKTVIDTFERLLKEGVITTPDYDKWWEVRLLNHPNKTTLLKEKETNPQKFKLLMLMEMGILKASQTKRETVSFDYNPKSSNSLNTIQKQIMKYVRETPSTTEV